MSLSTIPSLRKMDLSVDSESSGLCVTMIIVLLNLFESLLSMEKISSPVFESRLPVGSSARIIVGSLMSDLAIATLCCCPPLRFDGLCFAFSSIPSALRIFRDFIFIFLLFVRFSQPGTQTDARRGKFKKELNNCAVIQTAFSSLLSRYSFSKTRKLSSSIRRSSAR